MLFLVNCQILVNPRMLEVKFNSKGNEKTNLSPAVREMLPYSQVTGQVVLR